MQKDIFDDILYALCRHNVSIYDGWHPYSAPAIANRLEISVHKVRYHLQKLKTQGFVNSFYESGQTEEGHVFCYWGWQITEKAFDTAEYKKAYEEEKELCKRILGIDI